jgi:hypothetical protein
MYATKASMESSICLSGEFVFLCRESMYIWYRGYGGSGCYAHTDTTTASLGVAWVEEKDGNIASRDHFCGGGPTLHGHHFLIPLFVKPPAKHYNDIDREPKY